MGDPKKIRRKYETPSIMWDTVRIQSEHNLKELYGLKNLRELWILDSELRRIRKNVRDVLSGGSSEATGREIIARLSRYGIVKGDAKLDDLLILNVEAFLERRLQTVVFRKGLAKTIKQARQLVAHGLISINGKRMTSPGHLVLAMEENRIGYYKPINLEQAAASAPAPVAAQIDQIETAEQLETEIKEAESEAESNEAAAESKEEPEAPKE
jgi:small subunit ribosomal protein S4